MSRTGSSFSVAVQVFSCPPSGPENIRADQLSHKFSRCSADSVTEPTKTALKQRNWQSWELYALAQNCEGNPIVAVTPFDVKQAIVVKDLEPFPVLHAERPRLTAIEQDGPDYCRLGLACGFTRYPPS